MTDLWEEYITGVKIDSCSCSASKSLDTHRGCTSESGSADYLRILRNIAGNGDFPIRFRSQNSRAVIGAGWGKIAGFTASKLVEPNNKAS
jgi:hypothetical protein